LHGDHVSFGLAFCKPNYSSLAALDVLHSNAMLFASEAGTCRGEAIVFAGDYGVKLPILVPTELEFVAPVHILVEFNPRTTPARHPAEVRRAAVEYCRRRGILAGLIDTIGWPLVRCCLCHRLVSADQARISQEDCMVDDHNDPAIVENDCDGYFSGDTPLPYCNYGCARAHQAWMQKEYGDDATGTYSTDYYLQPLIDVPLTAEEM
jgi:hypothetical protein